MAVGAHRPQITLRIHDVFAANVRQRTNVMNMNVILGFLTVGCLKTEPADAAFGAVSSDAYLACEGIAFIAVDLNSPHASFSVECSIRNLFGKSEFSQRWWPLFLEQVFCYDKT